MEPKARIKSGLIAVALGLTTSFSTADGLFPSLGNIASAQPIAGRPVAVMNQAGPVAPALNLQQAMALSSQKLHAARKAVATKDIANAQRLTAEVKAMNLPYRETDDRPENVERLVYDYNNLAEIARTAPGSDHFRRSYAVFSLNQAQTMLQRGELDLAVQLTQEAANQSVVYNHAERQAGLEPSAMFKRIDDARRVHGMSAPTTMVAMQQPLSQAAQSDLNQSMAMLRQAREVMNVGQLDRAEQLCRVAAGYNLAESIYPAGSDTPNKLLAEVAARRQSMIQNMPAGATQVAVQQTPVQMAPAVYNAPQNQGQMPAQPIQQVQGGIANAQWAQNAPHVANSPIVDQVMRDRQAVINQISSEIMQQISDARKASEQNNPEAGLDILKTARERVEKSQIDEQTKRTFVFHIDRAIEETVKFIERHESQFDQNLKNQAVLEARRQEAEQFRNKEERLKTLIDECNRLLDEHRYDEAVILAKKAREFAPNESATHMLLTATQLAANSYRSIQIRDQKAGGFNDAMLAVDATSIPLNLENNPVLFGDNWAAMKNRRRGSDDVLRMYRPETELQILKRLEEPVSLSLDRPMPLEQVLKLLEGQTGVGFFVDWPALREVDVTSDELVSVSIMKEIQLKSVLNLILESKNLSYVVKDEMLKITSATKAKGELYSRPYYVGDLIMGIPNFNGQNPNDLNSAMDRAMRTARSARNGSPILASNTAVDQNMIAEASNKGLLAQVGTGQNMAGAGFGQAGFGGQPGMGGTNSGTGGGEADFSELMDLIEAVVSPDSWDEGDMMEYMPNLSLVVRQTEEVHAEIVDLLAQLRKLNDLQIAVEVRYITLSDDFYEKMGIDFDMIFKNDGAAGRIITGADVPTPDEAGEDDDDSSPSSTIMGGRNVTVGLSTADNKLGITGDLSIPIMQGSYGLAQPDYGGFQMDGGLTMGFALLNQIETYFFMNATQGDSRSNILQAPKVMIFNGQMGAVTDVTMQPFVTSVIPYVGDFAAAYQPVIVMLNEGQYMTVQGTVSNNRQYVRLTLNPIFSKITKVNTFRYVGEDEETDETETSAKGNADAPTTGDERGSRRRQTRSASGVTIQLPSLATFSVQTTVSVPDGGTILLGGIKRLSEGRKENGVPMLDKIPYINRLFMNTAIGRNTQSIMMTVTPRIIIQEEEEEFITGIRPTP